MTLYIPIVPILWGMALYALVGMVLFVPMVYWQARFIANYGTQWQAPTWAGVRIWRGLLVSALLWPLVLGHCILTEIRYRKKGFLPKKG